MDVKATQVPPRVHKITQGAINSTHEKSLTEKVVVKKGIMGVR